MTSEKPAEGRRGSGCRWSRPSVSIKPLSCGMIQPSWMTSANRWPSSSDDIRLRCRRRKAGSASRANKEQPTRRVPPSLHTGDRRGGEHDPKRAARRKRYNKVRKGLSVLCQPLLIFEDARRNAKTGSTSASRYSVRSYLPILNSAQSMLLARRGTEDRKERTLRKLPRS